MSTTLLVSTITLVYECEEHSPEEGYERAYQPLADIGRDGTAICPECGEDMDLTDTVIVR